MSLLCGDLERRLWADVARGRQKLLTPPSFVRKSQKTIIVRGQCVVEEQLQLHTEPGHQGCVPLVVCAPEASTQKRPTVILIHGTGGSKNSFQVALEQYASSGYVAVALDLRYHGERCNEVDAYQNAIIRHMYGGVERPFILDNLWDLSVLLDSLVIRPDVDSQRIGVVGTSLGGQHAWLLAAMDGRVAAVVPMISVHSFKWAVYNNRYQARICVFPRVFQAAADRLNKAGVDQEVVIETWQQILPGFLGDYDAPGCLSCIAPRPVLVVNGEFDQLTPLESVYSVMAEVRKVYQTLSAESNLSLYIQERGYHEITENMNKVVKGWLDHKLCGKPLDMSMTDF